jgi:muramidase (phage lysozyme)
MTTSLVTLVLSALLATACGQNMTEDANALTAENGEHFVLVSRTTVLKKYKEDSAGLKPGSEKCEIPANTKVVLSETPKYDGNHFLVNTAEMLPDCGFSKGYIFNGHVGKTSLRSAYNANVRAFLDTIGYAEGTGDDYNIIFTFARFSSFADHPRIIKCSYGLCSDAAGRYQFLSTTWDNLANRLSLPDFSPESQDRAAVLLLKDAGVYGTVSNIANYDDFSYAAYRVGTTWASFPGSPYGQPKHSASTLYSKFKEFLNRY